MKRRIRTGAAAALALALSTGACSDSTGVSDLDQAAAVELAMEMGFELIFMGMDLWTEMGDAAPTAAFPTLAATTSFNETIPCEAGGVTAVQGTVTDEVNEAGTGTFSMTFTQTPSNCAMETSQGVFTVNGNPNLSASADATIQEWDIVTMTMNLGGGFTWSGQGGSGSCNMSLNYSFNFQTWHFSMTGSVCGHNISTAA